MRWLGINALLLDRRPILPTCCQVVLLFDGAWGTASAQSIRYAFPVLAALDTAVVLAVFLDSFDEMLYLFRAPANFCAAAARRPGLFLSLGPSLLFW